MNEHEKVMLKSMSKDEWISFFEIHKERLFDILADFLSSPVVPEPVVSPEESAKSFTEKVTSATIQFLQDSGLSRSLSGFDYILCCIQELVDSDGVKRLKLSNNLYPPIAKKYNVDAGNIDRCIRNAIFSILNGPHAEEVTQKLGYEKTENISTAVRFLYALAHWVYEYASKSF